MIGTSVQTDKYRLSSWCLGLVDEVFCKKIGSQDIDLITLPPVACFCSSNFARLWQVPGVSHQDVQKSDIVDLLEEVFNIILLSNVGLNGMELCLRVGF